MSFPQWVAVLGIALAMLGIASAWMTRNVQAGIWALNTAMLYAIILWRNPQ